MDSLASYVATGVVSLIVGLALRELEPKVKIVWWGAHQFLFEIPEPRRIDLLTQAITIQNIGRKSAEDVEIVHKRQPDFFKLWPALDYEESTTPAGEHVVRVKSLGPKEFFTIEFLSYATRPELQLIRSKAGQATLIPIQFQRVLPRWLRTISIGLLFIGLGFVVYWLLRAGVFILRGIGVLGG
jgi:hypothetical protein